MTPKKSNKIKLSRKDLQFLIQLLQWEKERTYGPVGS